MMASMTIRRFLSLLLAVQLLLTQLLACHCHAGTDGRTAPAGAAPHVHLSIPGIPGCCCGHPHADEATDPSCPNRHDHDADAFPVGSAPANDDPTAVYPLDDLAVMRPSGESERPDGGVASLSPCPVEVSPCLAALSAVLLWPVVLGQPPGPLYLRLRTLLI